MRWSFEFWYVNSSLKYRIFLLSDYYQFISKKKISTKKPVKNDVFLLPHLIQRAITHVKLLNRFEIFRKVNLSHKKGFGINSLKSVN